MIIGVFLASICIILVYRGSSKPLYIVPRLIILGLLADIVIMAFIYIMLDQGFTGDPLTVSIQITVLTIANMTLMVSGSYAFELIIKAKISTFRIAFTTFLVGNVVATGFGVIFSALNDNIFVFEILTIVQSIFILIGLIYWFIIGVKDLRFRAKDSHSANPLRKSPWTKLLILVVLLMIPLVLVAITHNIETNNFIISLNAIILFVMVFYFRSKRNLRFLYPTLNNFLLISDVNGNLKYSYNFSLQQLSEEREGLLTGWVNGIANVLSEFFDEKVKPDTIQLGSFRIYLYWSEFYMLAFLTDQQSVLYEQAIKQLGINIQGKFGIQAEIMFNKPVYLDLEEIVVEAFDFI